MSLERCEILTDAKSGLGAQGEKTQGLSQGVAAKKSPESSDPLQHLGPYSSKALNIQTALSTWKRKKTWRDRKTWGKVEATGFLSPMDHCFPTVVMNSEARQRTFRGHLGDP